MNVLIGFSENLFKIATITLESKPPESKAPRGASLILLLSTASSSKCFTFSKFSFSENVFFSNFKSQYFLTSIVFSKRSYVSLCPGNNSLISFKRV